MKWFKEKFNKLFFAIEEEEYEITPQEINQDKIHNELHQENKKNFVFPVIKDHEKLHDQPIVKPMYEEIDIEQKLQLPMHLRQEGGVSKVYDVEVSGIRELLERRRNSQTKKVVRKTEPKRMEQFLSTKEQVFLTNESIDYSREQEKQKESRKKFVPTHVPSPVHGFMKEPSKKLKKAASIEELFEKKNASKSPPETLPFEKAEVIEQQGFIADEKENDKAIYQIESERNEAITDSIDASLEASIVSNEQAMNMQTQEVVIAPSTVLDNEADAVKLSGNGSVEPETSVEQDVQAMQVDQISFTNSTIHIENLNVTESAVAEQTLPQVSSHTVEETEAEPQTTEVTNEEVQSKGSSGSRLPFNVLMLKSDKEKLATKKQLQNQFVDKSSYKDISNTNSTSFNVAVDPNKKEEAPTFSFQQLNQGEEEETIVSEDTSIEPIFNKIEEAITIEATMEKNSMESLSGEIEMKSQSSEPELDTQTLAHIIEVIEEDDVVEVTEQQTPVMESLEMFKTAEIIPLNEDEEDADVSEQTPSRLQILRNNEELTEDKVEELIILAEVNEGIVEAPKELDTEQPLNTTSLKQEASPDVANTNVLLNEPKPYNKPPTSILAPPEEMLEDTDWMEEQGEHLVEALSHFQVQAQVESIVQGPAVTQFEITVGHGTKVSKVRNLSDDIQLALAARDIRIDAPIPGKRSIGIEIPNRMSRAVRLSEVTDSERFTTSDSPLEAALGLDLNGKPVTLDLRKMPHGLIAGATGSGKSVCINSILVSLLYKSAPHELKLMLIDPKMVELAPFNHIPHLVSPVITDVKAATEALKWAVEEMERRYQLFMHSGTRDITRYNKLCEENKMYAQKLPYLLIVIDELADLMMMSPADVELAISRLAQKARACGIHLILATQRPSVDVITGTLKSNIPTRIAFAVSSQIDSRTILDSQGAERLLGRGDMLYLGNGMNAPQRIQGTFVTDEEIEEVVEYVRSQGEPNYFFKSEELVARSEVMEEQDELFEEVCRYVFSQGSASTSALQRRYHIGYNRAARLIDLLERHGFISEQKGSKPRDVYITEAILENTFS